MYFIGMVPRDVCPAETLRFGHRMNKYPKEEGSGRVRRLPKFALPNLVSGRGRV